MGEAGQAGLAVLRYQTYDIWHGTPEYQFFVLGPPPEPGGSPALRRPELDRRVRMTRAWGAAATRSAAGETRAQAAAAGLADGAQPRRSTGLAVFAPGARLSSLAARTVRVRAKIDEIVGLRGSQVECPCCGGRFRAFSHYNKRPRAACPGCGARERHRALWLYLRDELGIERKTEQSLLHFAPEPEIAGRLERVSGLDYTTADLQADRAQESIDITAIPRPDESFDVVLVSHVLEHVPDDGRALSELHRVLKPGGRAVLQHPIDFGLERTYEDWSVEHEADRRRHFGQRDHVRIYGVDFLERVRAPGFEVSSQRYGEKLPYRTRIRYGLREYTGSSMRGMDIYVGGKPAAEEASTRGSFT